MKNKVLGYLLGGIVALSMGFITPYVNAQGDVSQCKNECSIAYGTDPGVYDCYSQCESASEKQECNGIKLNTNFPIIGNCIGDNEDVTKTFPSMVGALTKIVMSLILVVCFILVIVAGIMRAGDNPGQWKGGGAKGLLAKVAITILLLGFSGVILKLINPNFFVS